MWTIFFSKRSIFLFLFFTSGLFSLFFLWVHNFPHFFLFCIWTNILWVDYFFYFISFTSGLFFLWVEYFSDFFSCGLFFFFFKQMGNFFYQWPIPPPFFFTSWLFSVFIYLFVIITFINLAEKVICKSLTLNKIANL